MHAYTSSDYHVRVLGWKMLINELSIRLAYTFELFSIIKIGRKIVQILT